MQIGKAKIEFRAVGCSSCGAPVTPRDRAAERIKVTVGDRRTYIELQHCPACVSRLVPGRSLHVNGLGQVS